MTQLNSQQDAGLICKFWIYINLITSLNLTLIIVILTSATTSVTTSTPNTIASSFTADNSYNISYTISAFSVVVKPAFTKYLEETRVNLIKRITQPKYNNFIS